jgi:adenylate cyclase
MKIAALAPALEFPPALVRIGIMAIAVLLTVCAPALAGKNGSFFADEWLRDHFIQWRVSNAAEPRILVVDIDEASMDKLGPWPWPRARLADLVEILLDRYAARGIALDIVLPEPADAGGDARLAMLAQHGPVVLAQAFDYNWSRPQALRQGVLAAPSARSGAQALPAAGYIANHAGLANAAQTGNIGFVPDADGVLRRVPLLSTFGGKSYAALELALLDCCSGQAPLHINKGGARRIDYRRDWNAYTVVSAADILAGAIDPASARSRLVIVGSSSLGLADRVATPLAANRPGLGVQAAMLSTLLDEQAGVAPARWPGQAVAIAFAALTALVTALAFTRLSAAASVALLASGSALWLMLAFFVSSHDPHFVTTGPLASNLFLLAFAVPYQWQLAQRKSRHLLDTLRQYVAPAVVQELLRRDLRDPLKPRQLEVTTLIADMEGYTTQVESLPVEEAAQLTRQFLDCLTGPVIDQLGTLDKYTGDGLVAFWGAPLAQQFHADLALDAAAAILLRVRALSDARVKAGHAPLRVRIGIESGIAMAGDFGTSFRSIYTAVGDSVNTASRLEQAARDFAHDVMIGAGTVAAATRHDFLLLGERRLRGKENATTIYTLADTAATGAGA